MPDVLLRDRSGEQIAHYGKKSLRVPTVDGGKAEFVSGTVIEKTVDPDFSAGNMEVPAEGDELFAKVTVQRPETLLPENIVSGVNVAGVVGSYKGSVDEGVQESEVNFYDYDGTLLYAYTVAEAVALTELPPLPTHEGLVCQGWNYTLNEIKQRNSILDIGAIFNTVDGKTRIYINIPSNKYLDVYLWCFGAGTSAVVNIDWGDGTSVSHTYPAAGSGGTSPKKKYSAPGRYCITLSTTSKLVWLGGGDDSTTTSNKMIFGSGGIKNEYIEKIHMGNNIRLCHSALLSAYGLKAVTIPEGIEEFIPGTFFGAHIRYIALPRSVKAIQNTTTFSIPRSRTVSIPNNVTGSFGIGESYLKRLVLPPGITQVNALQNQYNLKNFDMPSGVTTIGANVFRNCYEIESITVPEGVTAIGNYFANGCSMLKRVILPSTVTSVGTYCFNICGEIYVPDDMVDTYKAMTNLSEYASIIHPISEMLTEESE